MFNQKKLMKKTTFQRKQYVIKKLLIFMIVGFVSNLNAQTTLLTVGSSGTVTISSEGTLNISCLELSPSTDFTINQTQVSVDLEATSFLFACVVVFPYLNHLIVVLFVIILAPNINDVLKWRVVQLHVF